MACRNEGFGSANTSITTRNLLLERIAFRWEEYCARKPSNWNIEYDCRIEAMNIRPEARRAFEKKYNKWNQQLCAICEELKALLDRCVNLECLTPADWDAALVGKERKVFALLAPLNPREAWPKGVPYLNLIARALYDRDERCRRAHYVHIYRDVVLDIAQRGARIMGCTGRRFTGNTTDGIGPRTAQQARPSCKRLQVERQSSTDWSRFEQDMYQHIVTPLQGECVLGRQWSAYVWAGDFLKTRSLADSDEAKDRVV